MSADQEQHTMDEDSLQGITRKESRLEIMKKHFPYWILPLISATVWFGEPPHPEKYLQAKLTLILW